jgi:hypothetical protein
MTGWQINAARAYQTIPNKNKAYMFVTDDLRTYSGNQGDGVIREKASLHHAVQDSPSANNFFKMMCRSVYGGHNASRKELKSVAVNDLDGEQIFDSFVRRVTR